MQLKYAPLFSVMLRHAFYARERCPDLVAAPTPACRRLLADAGLIFRAGAGGFDVYARVRPGTDPPALFHPLGDDALRFAFVLRPQAPHFAAVTDLPPHRADADVFYFDNLRDDVAGGRRHLGDSLAGARLGTPVRLVTRPVHVHVLPAPAANGTVTLRDRYGTVRFTAPFAFPTPVDAFRLDWRAAGDPPPGVYEVTDDQGGAERLYYDPGLFGWSAFGVVEVFSRTDAPDGVDRVPAGYRFLDGDEVTGQGVYTLGFGARATTWRYVVVKKYETNGVDLNDLAVTGDLAFPAPAVDGDRAVFTSNAPATLAEVPRAVVLEHRNRRLRSLPSPGLQTPLQEGAAPGQYTSELYVYV